MWSRTQGKESCRENPAPSPDLLLPFSLAGELPSLPATLPLFSDLTHPSCL